MSQTAAPIERGFRYEVSLYVSLPLAAFSGDVPPHVTRQLTDNKDPDQVAHVLDRAVRVVRNA